MIGARMLFWGEVVNYLEEFLTDNGLDVEGEGRVEPGDQVSKYNLFSNPVQSGPSVVFTK